MLRTLTLTFLLAGAAADAQTLAPQAVLPIDVLAGADLVGPITLTPERPGDELLFRSKLWRNVVFVAVPHPTKSGPLGVYPVPGLCVESAQAFALADVAIAVADVDGDGTQDVIGTSPNGVAQVLKGIGLSACR